MFSTKKWATTTHNNGADRSVFACVVKCVDIFIEIL